MPPDTLFNVVSEAVRINASCGKKAVRVGIRGFVGGSMKRTIKSLYALSSVIKKDIPMTILAKEFKAYDVKEVPFIIVRSGKSEKILMGDMSIQHAVETAQDGEITGMTYSPIIEEDFHDMMAAKATAAETRLRKKRYDYDFTMTKYNDRFRKADRDNMYRIDPSHTVEQDIRHASGVVIIPKGTVVDPSDYAPLGKYVFIDGNDEKEVNYAISLKPRQIIIVSGNPATLSRKYKMPFYVADDMMINRLDLTKTPSVIEQDGRYIRVLEKKL